MPILQPNLFDQVLNVLWPRLKTADDRDALLPPRLSAKPEYKAIDWSGSAEAFTSRLIELLPHIDLADVLSAVSTGSEQREHIQSLRAQVLACAKIPPTPGDPSATYASRVRDELSAPRYQIDTRFVELTLLIEQGPQTQGDRYVEDDRRTGFSDLREVLALDGIKRHAAIVLLGRPGSGKSTLLRHLQFDTVLGGGKTPFFVSLNRYRGDPAPDPMVWLADEWRMTAPGLPPLERMVAAGRALLLLDALNEMPHRDAKDYSARIALWQHFLHDLPAGNQVIFSCRSLDYSAPLSSESDGVTVQQVTIRPMGPDQIHRFLVAYLPEKGAGLWAKLKDDTKLLDLYSTPYFLRLLTKQADAGDIPRGRAELFTGFVRRALKREIEKTHRLLQPGGLLTRADHLQINQEKWATRFALPERGCLIPRLSALAYAMQHRGVPGEGGQVSISISEAIQMLDHPRAEDILDAGCELSIIDRDIARDEVLFFHQLLQEYFAARVLAAKPEPELARSEWRADRVGETLADTMARLQDYEPLPPLPSTGWEESAVIATAMARDRDTFVRGLIETNLPLAGRCAADPGAEVDGTTKEYISFALIARTRDLSADLRARIAAGLALGELGDPRLVESEGKPDMYLMPLRVKVEGGRYTLGDKNSPYPDERLEHQVELATFEIGQFPVTNAEYRRFIDAKGYDDDQWWDTPDARTWRKGGNSAIEAQRHAWREHRLALQARHASPSVQDMTIPVTQRPQPSKQHLPIREWSEDEFETWLERELPLDGRRFDVPRYWDHPDFCSNAQPVVGISWFEARAYCAWLAHQSSLPFRLPTEAEWEAVACGNTPRRYPYGPDFDIDACNTNESRIKRTTPIGVFPVGDTPEKVGDMCGNVWEWTSSAYLSLPYAPTKRREDPSVSKEPRVVRGGSWLVDKIVARARFRNPLHPAFRNFVNGFRVACGPSPY